MIGQDKAIRRVAKALDLQASGLRVEDKPIYVSLVIGGAASGKTLLAKILAEFLFGSPDSLTIVPCSDFFEYTISQWDINKYDYFHVRASSEQARKILDVHNANSEKKTRAMQALAVAENSGADDAKMEELRAQYEAADKEFKNFLKKSQPILIGFRSVVVFDHIEDGRPEVQDELSRILERGLQIRGFGEEQSVVSFRNSIIFITSNDCVNLKSGKRMKKLGFAEDSNLTGNAGEENRRYLKTIEEINDHFSKRLLSHLDRVEIFKEYSEETLLKILEIFIRDFQEELKGTFPVKLSIDDDVKKYLVAEGSDHAEHGIRLLKRKFDKYIRGQLGLLKFSKQIVLGDIVSICLKTEGVKKFVVFRKKQ